MLSVQGLGKRYAERVALHSLSFELQAGEFVALLGPNGAGKSTLFQLLTGLFSPDSGRILVQGIDLRDHPCAALARIGVVFQQMSLDLDLSVRRNLKLHAALHGLPGVQARERIEEACERLGLTEDLDRRARELSGGTRRKVELARAMLHRPALLLMDEATVGLDPKSRHDLLAVLHEQVRQGLTVLWATHWVQEAEQADRVMLLHRGQLLAQGAVPEVVQALGGGSLEAAFLRATA